MLNRNSPFGKRQSGRGHTKPSNSLK